MSCKNTCSRRTVKSIKFDELSCSAHAVSHDDLDHPFALVGLDGVTYMELAICPVAGSEFTALFEIAEVDDGFGVIVPDYVADLNEKLLTDLDIIPIIVDDPEFEDEDEDDEEDAVDEGEQDSSDEDLGGIEKLAALDIKAKNMLVAALKTPVGKDLFRRFVAADSQEEELHWLTQMLDFVTYLDSRNTEQPAEKCADKEGLGVSEAAKADKLIENLLNNLFSASEDDEEEESDSSEDKHSCKGCGKCKSGSGKVGEIGAGMIGMRIGDMPKKLQDVLKAQLGVPSEEGDKEADTKVNVPVNQPVNKPCASGVRWSEDEDKELLKLGVAVGCFGISWDDVADKLGRTSDACRKRFYKIKGIQK